MFRNLRREGIYFFILKTSYCLIERQVLEKMTVLLLSKSTTILNKNEKSKISLGLFFFFNKKANSDLWCID